MCGSLHKPVPTIVDAACMLFAKHNVADIRAARSDAINLRATTEAILIEIEQARTDGERLILFVTGIPGAGKTLRPQHDLRQRGCRTWNVSHRQPNPQSTSCGRL